MNGWVFENHACTHVCATRRCREQPTHVRINNAENCSDLSELLSFKREGVKGGGGIRNKSFRWKRGRGWEEDRDIMLSLHGSSACLLPVGLGEREREREVHEK